VSEEATKPVADATKPGDARDGDTKTGAKEPERVKRSPRHVKAAARILQKEANRILSKYGRRLAAEPAAAIRTSIEAIDTLRKSADWERLEEEAERLDEILHQHASFARKSALRETVENISVAILIALGLRSCFYEPFKIPSGSMMPTLLAGDHIFVNKFVYGVQIPFTTTVVGKGIGEIERGDVIVFRYPLDESEDFIKRVIGLPGDEIKVSGRAISIKRAGDEEFEIIPREKLDRQCIDETGRVEPNCTLHAETLDNNEYMVRYTASLDDRGDLASQARVIRVPEDHLLVMGDNRNQSHDSLAWKEEVEAVGAENLLTIKDLRDLTRDQDFSLSRPDDLDAFGDPKHDRVTYLSIHRSRSHDMELSIWRQPALGARHVFEAAAERIEDGESHTMQTLLEGRGAPTGVERDRVLAAGEGIDTMVAGRSGDGLAAVVHLEGADAVLWLQCGRRVCRHPAQLAVRLAEVLAGYARDHEQDARGLLVQPKDVRYSHHWTGRSDARDHVHERVFTKAGAQGRRSSVRLRAFRKPNEGVELLRDAALGNLGSTTDAAARVPDLGEAWLVEEDDAWGYVSVDPVRELVVLLECGKAACRSREQALALARTVQGRVPRAASDRRKLAELLVSDDVSGWPEVALAGRDRHEFDRVRLEGTVRGKDHAIELEAWLEPSDGLASKLGLLQTELGLQPDDSVVEDGLARHTPDEHTFIFAVAESNAVVRVTCRTGLCTDSEMAVAMARRAASKAADRSQFVDPSAERPRPFVPRGNVKGRAERIWLPLSRFWLPIR
jgi:signal peptidase I